MVKSKTECSCDSCKGACETKPGWFMHGEAEKSASLLGMDIDEFFKTYLMVDWYENVKVGKTIKDIFVLAPAIVGADAGSEYPADPRGKCVFLKIGKCKIHAAKPYECAKYMHGDEDEVLDDRKNVITKSWINNQKQIRELLGRKPETKEW